MNGASAISLDELLEQPISTAPALVATMLRELVPEDLLALAEPRGVQPTALKRVRTIHHQIARMLATGDRPIEVAAATGYSLTRISILQNDLLFQELMVFYTDQETERFADMQEQIKNLGRAATEELFERVTSDEVEGMTTKDLRQIMETALDRSGHSPVQRKQSISVALSGEELKALKGRVDGRRTDRIIEAEIEIESDSGASVGRALGYRSPELDTETAAGSEGEG